MLHIPLRSSPGRLELEGRKGLAGQLSDSACAEGVCSDSR